MILEGRVIPTNSRRLDQSEVLRFSCVKQSSRDSPVSFSLTELNCNGICTLCDPTIPVFLNLNGVEVKALVVVRTFKSNNGVNKSEIDMMRIQNPAWC
mmetsp:Transcript_9880/g.18005  ORF Transcript_9880/g.18005 Transcript_9880/m.18005 type:complete len:98 (+) Transcript_9880:676-969(+)